MNLEREKGMKRIAVFLLLLITAWTGVRASTDSPPQYWLVFRSDSGYPNYQLSTSLMKINSWGQITEQPKQILPSLRHLSSSIALGISPPGELSFWLWGRNNSSNHATSFYHARIDRKTWLTKSIKVSAPASITGPVSSITHRADQNFMIVLASADVAPFYDAPFVASALNSFGDLNGDSWPVSPASDILYEGVGGAAVSSDGTVLLLDTGKGLLFQTLDASGIPIHRPAVVQDHNSAHEMAAFRITDPLPDGTRLVAYWRACATYGCRGENKLALQAVNSRSGLPIGDPTALVPDNYNEDAILRLWIDPGGRFVIYAVPEHRRVNLTSYNVLMFQPLDATGHPSGSPIPLVDQVDSFDLLEE